MLAVGIIPSRYRSTRFPGKPLVDIAGKSMIQRVYEQASSSALDRIIVATDDQRIMDHVQAFGGEVMMTSKDHQSGTDRCAEVAAQIEADIIVNIQGDEPFIQAKQLDSLIQAFESEVHIATLIKKTTDVSTSKDPNKIKVTIDKNGFALYFSRLPIPYHRDENQNDLFWYKHIGIYAYTKATLLEVTRLEMSNLEHSEKLEQLRWLENAYKIKTIETDYESQSVDVPADLDRIKL